MGAGLGSDLHDDVFYPGSDGNRCRALPDGLTTATTTSDSSGVRP